MKSACRNASIYADLKFTVMPVKRIADIDIDKRGLFTAIYGTEADEFFVDEDLRKYSLWQQLYLYLKEQGYGIVLFYDITHNFHSYSQSDLVKFLDPTYYTRASNTSAGAGRYSGSHINSPLKGYNTTAVSDTATHIPLLPAIQYNDKIGERSGFWRTSVDSSLLDYFSTVLPDKREKTAIVIKHPDNAHFENADHFLDFFREINGVYKTNDYRSKIIIAYQCSNSNALIQNLTKRKNNYLFVDDYFQSQFLHSNGDSYRLKSETTFQISFPEQQEVRNWVNRRRLNENIALFGSTSLDKILLRLIQERKKLRDLESYSLPAFINGINTRSGWDQLNEKIGLEAVKNKIKDIVDDIKHISKNNLELTYRSHLCFLGNPGTGKTTVASIIAEIFKEEGILPTGHYTYTKATELVGKHVGDAPDLVRQKCEEARGGLLFIDEAYGFIEEGVQDFGKAAITELIGWLEDKQWQKDTIVIMAGYPDEIEGLFRNANQGLKGRFTPDNFVKFENYTAPQLLEIFRLNARKNKMPILPAADEMLGKIFERLLRDNRGKKDWDNARRVENIFKLVMSNMRKKGLENISPESIPEDLAALVTGQAVKDIRLTDEYIELNALIGLEGVKNAVNDLIEAIEFEQYQIENGFIEERSIHSMHLVFAGPPGTGKTTVARLFGGLLKNLGILSNGEKWEVGRQHLVGNVVGDTEKKTNEWIQKAMGGVLFIDEAYTLAQRGENDFGAVAIDILVPIMENERDRFVVIAAGYEGKMEQFLASNQGLKDRFSRTIVFPHSSEDELIAVFRSLCSGKKLKINEACDHTLRTYFSRLKEKDGEAFSNSRAVRNLFEETERQKQKRLNGERRLRALEADDIHTILESDIMEAMKLLNPDALKPGRVSFILEPVMKKAAPPGADEVTKQILFDYCIIDRDVWMESKRAGVFLKGIVTLKRLYSGKNRKLVIPALIYKDLYELTTNKIQDGRSMAASNILKLINHFREEENILVQDDIYDFTAGEFRKGRSVLFITNDPNSNRRIEELRNNMKDIPLPAYKLAGMQEMEEGINTIYDALYKVK